MIFIVSPVRVVVDLVEKDSRITLSDFFGSFSPNPATRLADSSTRLAYFQSAVCRGCIPGDRETPEFGGS
jgi:hypothetical protein